MITSFPIKDLQFEAVSSVFLSVAEAPFYHLENLGCHVCKQHSTIGAINRKGQTLCILPEKLFITNGKYYYIPHDECRGLFSIAPLAYE